MAMHHLTRAALVSLIFMTLKIGIFSPAVAGSREEIVNAVQEKKQSKYERDRAAILSMAGSYSVVFNFEETVSFAEGYELKDPYRSGADEMVMVIKDEGDFISLQHILVVGPDDEKMPIKHWRQDWRFEPDEVLTFIGGNAWAMKGIKRRERRGQWSQTVYQVDDSPRYGGVGSWSHKNGISQWASDTEWRPLPRREMTTRDDYHAVDAINMHSVTPDGWVHEQVNSKLVLKGSPQVIAREIGVNTYTRNNGFDFSVARQYWSATKKYWAAVRQRWTEFEDNGKPFALTLKGEPVDLYMELFSHAAALEANEMSLENAVSAAAKSISDYTTTDLPKLNQRLR
ncbi:MAG: DUF6607 family protein [Pseudomonadota bacterium]